MVRINRVYTKAGDQGETALIGGDRVSKASARIDCYGTVDELNATLGMVRTALEQSAAGPRLLPAIDRIQNELFNLGARLATPDPQRRGQMPAIADRHVSALEVLMDELNEDLPALQSFILPGGGWPSACFHLARTVCRRAERLVVDLARSEDVEPIAVQYLNRLSDALFVMGRWAAKKDARTEPLWEPEKT
ncbi:MAG TPA: cob(I)yrinic acid a,c-diamide adenosyltransferase [Haliangium sp.]|nr:cob(I)yrinic acid a,c-diamide adenosyltransferase [Haliangium sp.]